MIIQSDNPPGTRTTLFLAFKRSPKLLLSIGRIPSPHRKCSVAGKKKTCTQDTHKIECCARATVKAVLDYRDQRQHLVSNMLIMNGCWRLSCCMLTHGRGLTTEEARISMSRKGLGSASQNLLNIIGNAVGRAECGSKPANNSE